MADPIIEEIKHKLDIVEVISNYLTLKQSGGNFKGLCPFHHEKTPSFMVNRERQIFRCFGCGETGDVFAFIMKQENIDFPNALKLLAARAGVTLPEKPTASGSKNQTDKAKLYEVNATAAKFFHHILLNHPAGKNALAYVKKRGVTEATIKAFSIGYAPSASTALQALFTKYGYAPQHIRSAGSPERFRDRLMFPFRDVIGQVVGFSGRALGDQIPKYLNTSETDIFRKNRFLYGLFEGKKAIGEAKKVLLVEGQLDLVLAHQAGTQFALATSGTALTNDHLTIIRRYSDTLLLGFDGDAAGAKAAERAISLALPHGFEVTVVAMPEGSDPGELIANRPEAWQQALAAPQSAMAWLFDQHFPHVRKPTPTEREQIYAALFPYITLLEDSVARSYALQELALAMGLNQDKAVHEAFAHWQPAKTAAAPAKGPSSEPPAAPESPPSETLRRERLTIGLVLLHPALLEYKQFALAEEDFTNATLGSLYKTIISWYTNATNKSSNDLISHVETTLPPANKPSLQKLLFDVQTYAEGFSPEQFLQEYSFLYNHLQQRRREARIQTFAEQIAQAEAANDRKQVLALMHQMQDTLKHKEMHAKENS